MAKATQSRLAALVREHEAEILQEWVELQISTGGVIPDSERRDQSQRFLSLFAKAVQSGPDAEIQAPHWAEARDFLAEISRSRAIQGFSPSETARFVFLLKQPLFSRLEEGEIWAVSALIDNLGLYTTEVYQKTREDLIWRQSREMLELSTPVVQLWRGILALPLIGTLDSARTQVVMETLLERIVATEATIAIIDITGVPTVDTLVAQHLLKTVAAARLMGADCIISGIRPQIAQTIVHLGVELSEVSTKASLADAFALALKRSGSPIGPTASNLAHG